MSASDGECRLRRDLSARAVPHFGVTAKYCSRRRLTITRSRAQFRIGSGMPSGTCRWHARCKGHLTFPQVKRMTMQQWKTDGRRGGTRDSQQAMGERIAPKLGWFSIALGAAQLVAPGALSNAIGVRESDDSRTLQRIVGVREVMAGVGILTADDPSRWLWVRVAGDLMDLALLG